MVKETRTAASANTSSSSTNSGQQYGSAGSGGIVMSHTTRTMSAYNFTESDLELISMTNWVSVITFAVATGIFGFCIEVNKDMILEPSQEPAAMALQFSVNLIGLPVSAAFAIIGGIALWKRGTIISKVKRESKNVGVSQED